MEELRLAPVHRYAAGALIALALRETQICQVSPWPRIIPQEIDAAFFEEAYIPESELWINQRLGLLRLVFRNLKIEEHTWPGLEETARSSSFKHHIGPFLKLLSEDENEATRSSTGMSNSENELVKAVDALAADLESTSLSCEGDCKNSDAHRHQSAMGRQGMELLGLNNLLHEEIEEARLIPPGRKLAVLFELVTACVADSPEIAKKGTKPKKGYDARHRASLRLMATWLNINWLKVGSMEIMLACSAMATLKEKEAEVSESGNSKWAKWKRGGIIGAAALTGGTLLAITGGLAAPAIAAGLGALAPTLGTILPVVGASGFAAAAAAAGSVAGSVAVAASFGAAGAGLSGTKMARRTGGVEEFEFIPIGDNHQQGRLAVGIVISGFVSETEDFTKPWEGPDGDLERYALLWESKILMAVSTAIQDWLTSNLSSELMKRGAMLTVLSTLVAALTLPSALLSATSLIDGKWSMAVDRSDKAGVLLAKALSKGLHGNRPVTLVGFSLGARVIFRCLQELFKMGESARLVERVVLLGAAVPLEMDEWKIARRMVAGRFINCYSKNDWILGIVYRASLFTQGLAGIQPVEMNGIENVDVTEFVGGHSAYLKATSEILQMLDLNSFYPIFGPAMQTDKVERECNESFPDGDDHSHIHS